MNLLTAVAASGGWTPKNSVFWYDPSLLNLADQARVDGLTDLTGNGHALTKASDATRPYYETAEVNGLGVLRFVYSAITRLIWSVQIVQSQPFAYHIVMSNTRNVAEAEYLMGQNHSDAIRKNSAGTLTLSSDTDIVSITANTGLTFSPAIFTFVANGANSAIRMNGSVIASGDIGSSDFTFDILGNGRSLGATDGWTGIVGEQFLREGAANVTVNAIQIAEQYLHKRTNIALAA